MSGITWLADGRLASQEGFLSLELVNQSDVIMFSERIIWFVRQYGDIPQQASLTYHKPRHHIP